MAQQLDDKSSLRRQTHKSLAISMSVCESLIAVAHTFRRHSGATIKPTSASHVQQLERIAVLFQLGYDLRSLRKVSVNESYAFIQSHMCHINNIPVVAVGKVRCVCVCMCVCICACVHVCIMKCVHLYVCDIVF